MSTDGNGEIGAKTIAAIAGIAGTALGVLVTYSTAVSSQQTETAKLTERISALDSRLSALVNDQYRSGDARRDFMLVNQQIGQNAQQITELRALFERHLNNDHDVQVR